MRIAFLTTEYPTETNFDGGLSSYLQRTAQLLVERGHEVEVFTRSRQRTSLEHGNHLVHQVPSYWPGTFLYHRIPGRKFFAGYHSVLKIAWSLNHALEHRHRDKPFDVVQATNCRGCGVVAAWRRRIPLITRVSGIQPLCDSADQLPPSRQSRQWDQLEGYQLKKSYSVYAPSHYSSKLISKRYQVNAHAVEPPVDTGHFSETVHTCPDNLPSEGYLLHFGTLSRLKGTDRLIAVLPRLFEIIPEMRIVFIGRGKQDTRGNHYHDLIRQRCPQHASRITVLDPIPHRELFRYVAHARLVALPSRIDNLPNTCLESMALKRVVVATQDASFDQLINHQTNGFLVPQDDEENLLRQLQTGWNLSSTERAQLGAAAHATLQRLAPERTISQLIDLFEVAAGHFQSTSGRLLATSDSV